MPTKLEQFRAQFPQYKDVSDKRLADALYDKYYADKLGRDEFYDRVGYYQSAPEALGLTVMGTPQRWYQGKLGEAQQKVESENLSEISDFEKRFAENKPAYPNMLERLTDPRTLAKLIPGLNIEYGQDLERQYQKLADFAATRGLKGQDQVEAYLKDPAKQQEFLDYMRRGAAEDSLRFQLKQIQAAPPEVRINPDDALAKYSTLIAQSALDMVPSIAVGAAAGRGVTATAAGLGTMFAQVIGGEYNGRRKTDPRAFNTFLTDTGYAGGVGLDPELAQKVAVAYGLAETIPEALPLGKVLGEGAKPFIKRMVELFVLEPGTEVVTEGAEILIDKLALNENMTASQIIGRLTDAAIGGVGAATTMAGVGAISDRVMYGPDGGKMDAITRPGPIVGTRFETLVEDNLDASPQDVLKPEPGTPQLLLPPPSKEEPFLARRQPPAPEIKDQVEPTIDEQAFGTVVRDTQDKLNEQNRKDKTSLLARSAQEQLKPIHVTADEANTGAISDLLGSKVGDIRAKRIQLGRDPNAPITLPELKAAKVTPEIIGQIKDLKQPATAALRALDSEKRGLDPLEFPETVANQPLADEPFNENQYKSAVMAITEKGRYSFDALKAATGITSTAKMAKLKQALIDRGHLVQSKNGLVPANQMRNERSTVPADLPEGAVTAHVVRELPVGAVRVRQTKNGKAVSLGVFNTQADAQAKISSIRANEDKAGGARSELRIEPAGKTAFGVVQKRYDKDGNFIGEAVVDSFATEAEARKAYSQNMEQPAAPAAPVVPEAQPQHRVVERQKVTGHRLVVNGNERTYPSTSEGLKQLVEDEAAAPEGAQTERSDITEPVYELVRDDLDAQGKSTGTTKSIGFTSSREDAHAEAKRLNSLGTIRNVPPKGLEGRVDEVVAALTRVAEQMGLPRIGGKVVLETAVTPTGGTQVIEGMYGRDGIIRLTVGHFTPDMSVEEITKQLAAVMRHETIHHLKTVGLLAPEGDNWKTLVNYANKAVDPKSETGETFLARAERLYTNMPGYGTPESIQEEAIAEAFRSWVDGKLKLSGKPAGVFRKIVDWFRRLIKELPRDIFNDIDSGKFVADRVRSPGATNLRNIDRNRLDVAVKALREANASADENAVRVATAEYLAARDQAREDNAGRSGFKTVLGTDANQTYAEGEFMPPEQVAALVSGYKERAGISTTSLPTTLQPNLEFVQKVAKAQEDAKHNPGDPAVKRAYTALTTETKAMFNSLGITIEPWRGNGQPYSSAAEMGRDIAANKRVRMRLTEEMFAATPSTADHPMRQNSGITATDGTALTNNDLFRVVHDIFGYDQIGLRPGYDADFTAYHEHARLYSDQARRAYATETLAQDAWHHFGPHLWRTDGKVALDGDVDFLPSERKEFAKQKAFLLPEDLLNSDPAFEQIKNAEGEGDLEQLTDERLSVAPVNVREAMKTQGRGLMQTRKVASLESAFALTNKKKFQTGRELKLAIEKRVKDAADKAGVDLTTQNDQVLYHLVKQGVQDALYALQTNANAIGWYNRTVNEALEIVSLLHPEIKTDQPSRLAFKTALAITSNGLKVNKNFELAEAAYSEWKRTGQMPTNIGIGTAADQINQSLGLFNRMVEDYGYETLERILMSPFTVGQLKKMGFGITGEGVNVVVRGAAVFGPKIGNGFFANLNGKFDALTIDRWLMRTWGRWTGNLIEKDQANIDRSLNEMTGVIDQLRQDPAAFAAFEAATGVSLNGSATDVAMALHDASTDAEVREQMNAIGRKGTDGDTLGSVLRKRANSAWKYLDGQLEQPTQSQRPFIRAAMDGVLRVLHGQGYNDLTMSDLQALLWYPEKRLYDSAKGRADTSGYADEEAPDYANAAAALARSKGVSTTEIANARRIGRENAEREAGAAPDGRAGAVEQRRGAEPEYAPATIEEAVGRLNAQERAARAKFLKQSIFVEDRIGRERDGKTRVYRGGSPTGAKGLRGVKTVFTPEKSFKNMLELAEMPAPVVHELHTTPENAEAFRELLRQSAINSKYGASVYMYDPADYQNFRLFLTADRTGGFAIKPDGDIVSVFSSGGGQVQPLLSLATQEGGKKLDCFDTVLPDIYDLSGFVEVGRAEWDDQYKPTVANGAPKDWDYETFKKYNNGRPDIVFMEFRPATAAQLTDAEARQFERLSATPVPMTDEQRRVAARLPGGKDYGRADLAPATVLSAPGTPAVALSTDRDGNRYFGGDVADEQLRQAQDGDRGATVTYMSPEDFVNLTSPSPQFSIDNPGGQWLADKIEYARAVRARANPDTYEANLGGASGVTGYFRRTLDIPVSMLKNLRGAMGEEKFRDSGTKLRDLEKSISEQGYQPDAILVHVREDGVPFIVEGNHRVAEAVKSGRKTIPGEIKYLRGGENAEGPLSPQKVLAAVAQKPNPNQQVFNAVPDTGYKFNAMPSVTFIGDKGVVRVAKSDGAYAARALIGKASSIPVVVYPEKGREFGLINGLTNGQTKVLFDESFPHEYFAERRGERFSVGSEKFQKFFGDSKVVDATGKPLVVYRGTGSNNGDVFDKAKSSDGAFWFAVEPQWANVYAVGEEANVTPVYLSIQNPAIVERAAFELDPPRSFVQVLRGERPRGKALSGAQREIKFEEYRRQGYDGIYDPVMDVWVAFEPTQIKSAIGNNGNWDAADPDIRYSVNTVGMKVPVSSPLWAHDDAAQSGVTRWLAEAGRSKKLVLGTSIYDLRVKLQDKFLSVEDAVKKIRAEGGVVNDLNDVYQVQQLSDGRAYYQIQDAEEELYKPVMAAIHAAHRDGISIDDVETYLLAKHAPERNAFLRSRGSPVKDPSGMSDTDAYGFINKMRAEGKAAQLENIANLVYRITRDTTAVRIAGGLINAQDAAASPFKFYVPLKGLDPATLDPEDHANDSRNYIRTGKGYSVSGKESRSPTGRTSRAYNILGNLINQHTEAILRAEKNRVAVSLSQLIKDNPNNSIGTILDKVPTRLVRSTNGMIRSVPDQNFRSQPDIVIAKVQGREVIMRITDPWVARAMRSANVPRVNKFVQGLGALNRFFATVNTSWNPEFLITNLFRDAQTAAILANRYDIKGFTGAILRDTPAAIAAVREVIRTGRTDSELAKYYDEMRRGGGTTEHLGIKTADQQVSELRGLLADTQLGDVAGAPVRMFKATAKLIEDYNKVAENALRLSAYANARRAGATVDQAAYIAKNLTVNFNKGGEYKAIANSLYLFYNASLSGTFVLLKGLKNKKVQRIAGAVVALGFMMDMVNRMLLSGDEDDDGVKDYDEIPEYVLRNNLVIMTGGKNYISIPMPYGFNFFHNVGRNIGAVVGGSPTKNIGSAVLSSFEVAFDAFNPLGGSGSLLNVIAPTIFDPVVDLVSNRDYKGDAIVPERASFDGLPTPNSQKFWNSTGGLFKDTSAFLNSISGGNETVPGWWDWSPEVLEYAVDYAFGAAGGFLQRGTELVTKAATGDMTGDDFDLIPFLRKTAGTVTTRSNSDRYYDQMEKVLLLDKSIKAAQKMGDSEMAQRRAAENPNLTRLIPTFNAVDNQLTALRKRRRLIQQSNLPPDQIREEVRKLRQMEDELMRRASVEYLALTGRAD